MGKITLTNIAEELVAKAGLDKDTADGFVRAFVEAIEKGLREDNLVKIKGLGTFKLMEVSERGSVDVNTGERITIKGHTKVTFTPDSAMKEFVNRPFAHFEPTELNDGYPDEEEPIYADGAESAEGEAEDIASAPVEIPVAVVSGDDTLGGEESHLEENQVDEASIEVVAEENLAEIEEETVKADESEEMEQPVAEENVEPASESGMEEPQEASEIVDNENGLDAADAESEEGAEVPSVENPILDTCPSPEGNTQTEEDSETSEEPLDSFGTSDTVLSNVTQQAAEPASRKGRTSRKGGLGWLVALLLIAVVAGVYYLLTFDKNAAMDEYDVAAEEVGSIVVNPNLEEELGAEWGDEPAVQTEFPKTSVEKSTSTDVVNGEVQQPASSVETENNSIDTPQEETSVTEAEDASALVITESLEAKSLKDITPADTTDYVIEGTLVTHELKRGETIILLSLKYYGDKRLWPYIVKYNWMKDFNNVAIGQMINIPVLKNKPVE